MKLAQLGLLLATFALAAQADVSFSGESAEYFFDLLGGRKEGVTDSVSRSTFNSPLENKHLHGTVKLLNCAKKTGWVRVSYKCNFPGTSASDINARKMLNLGSRDSQEFDDILNALVTLNWAVNQSKTLEIDGRSAERIFTKLNGLTQGTDASLFRRTSKSKWFGRPVEGVGISEIYCQKTDWGIWGKGHKCLVRGVTVSDSNAPFAVVN